jgi:hypothetical protein
VKAARTAQEPQAFAGFVKLLGRGKTARRSLTESEAEEAFAMVLDGTATEAQIGAFLMLLRVKEETPSEITGMVRAARAQLHAPEADLRVDLDWPSYAGKRQHHPWYLLSALLRGIGSSWQTRSGNSASTRPTPGSRRGTNSTITVSATCHWERFPPRCSH